MADGSPDAQSLDEASVMRYLNTLPTFADHATTLARAARARATLAAEKYPGDKLYVASLERAAQLTERAAAITEGLRGMGRKGNKADVDKMESPRGGSLRKESTADNRAAQQDHDTWGNR